MPKPYISFFIKYMIIVIVILVILLITARRANINSNNHIEYLEDILDEHNIDY